MARWAFVRSGVVRLSRSSEAEPSEADTRLWVFGDDPENAEKDLSAEGAWCPCPEGVGEDWQVDAEGVFGPPTYRPDPMGEEP